MGVTRGTWWIAPALLVGAVVWLEIFLRYPVPAVVLLVAIGGCWDYLRRRSKLKPR